MASKAFVSPQAAAAAVDALFGEAAIVAAQSPVPPTPPGVPQYALDSPLPARSIIDQQIADVEDRLDRRISQIETKMDNWQAQLNERLDRLLSAAPSVAAAAPPEPAAAAAPMAAPGPAQRLDPWS